MNLTPDFLASKLEYSAVVSIQPLALTKAEVCHQIKQNLRIMLMLNR